MVEQAIQLQPETTNIQETYRINRLDFLLLETIYTANCKSYYRAMTIGEIMESVTIATRQTIYKKLQKLVDALFIGKGILDGHSDTYYILEKGINLFEGGNV